MKTFRLVCLGVLYLLYVITMFLFGLSSKKKNYSTLFILNILAIKLIIINIIIPYIALTNNELYIPSNKDISLNFI